MTARMTTAEFQAEALRLTMQALDRACESHQPLRDVFEAEASERLAQLSQHFAALLDELEQLEAAVSLALDASRGCCGEFETGSGQHTDECDAERAADGYLLTRAGRHWTAARGGCSGHGATADTAITGCDWALQTEAERGR